MNRVVRFIVIAGVVAALYVVLMLIFMPISLGVVQVRVAEALCVLPMLTPAAIPGLAVGCLISNLVGVTSAAVAAEAVVFDVIFGSLTTLIAAVLSYAMRRNKWVATAPPVVLNALIIGAILTWAYKESMPYLFTVLYIAAGQAIACYGVGIPLYNALEKHKTLLFKEWAAA